MILHSESIWFVTNHEVTLSKLLNSQGTRKKIHNRGQKPTLRADKLQPMGWPPVFLDTFLLEVAMLILL